MHAIWRPSQLESAIQHAAITVALDVYVWTTYRLFTLDVAVKHGRRPEVQIPWRSLQQQMGSSCETIDNFRTWFLEAIKQSLAQYREAEPHVRSTPT